MTTQNHQQISVIGLGQMGKKIAELYTAAGFQVTVWNRTQNKANGLKGVTVAASLEAAILASRLHIVCVYDNDATTEILNSLPDKSILQGKTIVNFTTGSPKEAEALENLLILAKGHYLNGAIQVAPDQMGMADTTILMGGDGAVMEQYRATLQILGGNLRHLGNKAASSPAIDLATLSWLYGSYIGLMYGVKLVQSFDLKLEDYGSIIEEIVPGFTAFFKHELNMISQGNFEVTQSPLPISVSATNRIAATFKDIPVAQEFPQIIASILQEADIAYGAQPQELAVISKVLDRIHVLQS